MIEAGVEVLNTFVDNVRITTGQNHLQLAQFVHKTSAVPTGPLPIPADLANPKVTVSMLKQIAKSHNVNIPTKVNKKEIVRLLTEFRIVNAVALANLQTTVTTAPVGPATEEIEDEDDDDDNMETIHPRGQEEAFDEMESGNSAIEVLLARMDRKYKDYHKGTITYDVNTYDPSDFATVRELHRRAGINSKFRLEIWIQIFQGFDQEAARIKEATAVVAATTPTTSSTATVVATSTTATTQTAIATATTQTAIATAKPASVKRPSTTDIVASACTRRKTISHIQAKCCFWDCETADAMYSISVMHGCDRVTECNNYCCRDCFKDSNKVSYDQFYCPTCASMKNKIDNTAKNLERKKREAEKFKSLETAFVQASANINVASRK